MMPPAVAAPTARPAIATAPLAGGGFHHGSAGHPPIARRVPSRPPDAESATTGIAARPGPRPAAGQGSARRHSCDILQRGCEPCPLGLGARQAKTQPVSGIGKATRPDPCATRACPASAGRREPRPAGTARCHRRCARHARPKARQAARHPETGAGGSPRPTACRAMPPCRSQAPDPIRATARPARQAAQSDRGRRSRSQVAAPQAPRTCQAP